MNINKHLKVLTVLVRHAKGEKEALRFYIDYIQPIKKYFKQITKQNHEHRKI